MITVIILINLVGAVLSYFLLRKAGCDSEASLGGAILCWPLALILYLLWKIANKTDKQSA
jgi:hypothetical protein